MSDDDAAFAVEDDASSFELGDEVEQLPAPQGGVDAVDVDDHSAVHTEGVTPLATSSPSVPAASAPAVGGRSRRARAKVDYASINAGSMGYGEDPKRFEQLLATKHFTKPIVRELTGDQLTKEWIEHHGFRVPLLIRDSEGLDITVPSQDFTVRDVVRLVGSSTPLEVFDVATQTEVRNMTLGEWGKYYRKQNRRRVLNVISLEFSDTAMAPLVQSPAVVRDIDWIDKVWPPHRRQANQYPKVQYYCLMSVKSCFTDFHVDFGGTSVWYHVLHGAKRFFFIPPNEENLEKFKEWSNSNNQSDRFFGDEVDQCFYVDLAPGNTMLIPTGWIHAVLTPEDSLVFGGNFLHGYDVRGQLRVFELERQTSVPRKFRFPMYEHLQWFAAGHYLKFLRHPEFSKALEDTLAGGTQATAGTEGTLAAVGISRFELVGISALLKLLREIQRRSGVKRKAIRIVKKSEFSASDAAKEAAAFARCDSPEELLEEFTGRLSGTWTKPPPQEAPAPKIKLKFRAGAGTSAGAGAGAGAGASTAASGGPRIKLKVKRQRPPSSSDEDDGESDFFDEDDDGVAGGDTGVRDSDEEWGGDGQADYAPDDDDYFDEDFEDPKPKKQARQPRATARPRPAKRSRPSGGRRRAPGPPVVRQAKVVNPASRLRNSLKNLGRRRY